MRQLLPPPSVALWTMASSLGLGLFAFPRFILQTVGRGGLYAVLGVVILGTLSVALILAIHRRFPGQTAVEIQRRVWGRTLTGVVAIVVGVYLMLVLGSAAVVYTHLVATTVLQRTPNLVIASGIALTALFAAWQGPRGLSRCLQLVLPITMGFLILALLLAFTNVQWFQLAPTWSGVLPTLRGSLLESYVLFGMPNLMIVLGWTDLRATAGRVWLGWGINALALTLVFLAVVGTLGVRAGMEVNWPAAYVMKMVDIQGFLVERLGYLVIILWTVLEVLFVAVTGIAVAVATCQALGLTAKMYRRVLCVAVVLPVGTTFVGQNMAEVFFYVHAYLVWLGLVVMLGLPACIWLAAALRRMSGPPLWSWRTPAGRMEEETPPGSPPGVLPSGRMSPDVPEARRVMQPRRTANPNRGEGPEEASRLHSR